MTELLDSGVPREALAHTGFLLIALAFIVRDALVLHSRAIVAYCFFIGFASLATGGPAWHLIGWYVLFLAINGWQVARLLHERHFTHPTAEEKALTGLAFPALDACAVRRLIRRGRWLTLAAGDVLTRQGRQSDSLFVLLEGTIQVTIDGNIVCELQPGQFVGEIGFITGNPATATAVVVSDGARALAWDRCMLSREAARKPELRAIIQSALGADLASKIAEHTIRVHRGGATFDAEAETPGYYGSRFAA